MVSLLILRPLADLLVIDISLYGAGISLEFIALIRLRKKAAQDARPFKIPLQKKGLIILFIPPLIVFSIALSGALLGSGQGFKPAIFALAAIFSAHIAWLIVRRRKNFVEHHREIVDG